MRETYYRINVLLKWQLLFGISFNKHSNGYKCHSLRIELPLVSIVIDISREVDEFIKFENALWKNKLKK